MKDAKGHGSNAKGSHSSGIDKIPGWSAIKMVSVNSLIANADNIAWIKKYAKIDQDAKRPTNVETIRAAIRRGEPITPIAVDKNNHIIDGHNRWLAHKAEHVKTISARVQT